MEQGRDDLAEKVAEQIANLDGLLATTISNRDLYQEIAASMEASIKDTDARVSVAREEQRKASGEDLVDELAAAGIGDSTKSTTASILEQRRKALVSKGGSPSE